MVLPGKKNKPEDVLWMLWRRKWAVLIPFVVVFAGTLAVSRFIHDRYRSETVILVVPQRVPEDYVRSTVTTKIEDRLRSIQQQILSRTRLELIIRDFNLYPAERARMPMEDVVQVMRRDVQVTIVRGDAFRVAYISDDPRRAMQVAERLASEFTNESLQDREVLATATSDFLTSQLDDARKRLSAQEAKFADFQRRHAGQLPSERESNVQVMHNLQLQVQALDESENRDRDRRLLLERTLADLQSQPQRAAPSEAAAQAGAGGGPPAGTADATTEQRLDAARETLKGLEMHLKPEHPDVLYMKRVIADLENKARTEAAAPPAVASVANPPRPRTPEEAATQRRIEETREEIASLDIQLATKQNEAKRLRDQIAVFQGRVAATPALEAELTALTRDYDTVQKVYDTLLAKQEESKVSAALERRQIGEVFKVLDPARLPESPASPNRPMIDLLGALAGLGAGFGLAFLLDYRDKGLRSESDVVSVLNLPVLATIPVIQTRRDRRRERRKRILSMVGAAAAVVILAGAGALAWSAGWIHRPLWLR